MAGGKPPSAVSWGVGGWRVPLLYRLQARWWGDKPHTEGGTQPRGGLQPGPGACDLWP